MIFPLKMTKDLRWYKNAKEIASQLLDDKDLIFVKLKVPAKEAPTQLPPKEEKKEIKEEMPSAKKILSSFAIM